MSPFHIVTVLVISAFAIAPGLCRLRRQQQQQHGMASDQQATSADSTSRESRFAHLANRGDTREGIDDDEDWERGSVDTQSGGTTSNVNHRRPQNPSGGSSFTSDHPEGRNHNNRGMHSEVPDTGRNVGARHSADIDDTDDDYPMPHRGCPRCEMHEQYKRRRLEEIKAEILRRLNFKEPPNISNRTLPQNPTVSQFINKFAVSNDEPDDHRAESTNGDEHDPYHVKPLDILLMAKPPPANLTINNTNICYFALNSEIYNAKSIKAEFHVYVKRSKTPSQRVTILTVSKILRNNESGIYTKRLHMDKIMLRRETTGRWFRFNLDKLVRTWVEDPTTNLGLQVEMYDADGTPLAIVQTDNPDEKPYLEVQVKGSSRPKRNIPAPDCTAMSKEKRCCRYPLIVDFVAMNWDWILAPKQYKAYYCYGNCPFAYYRPYPHTHVVTQTLVSDFTPCCTASKLKQLLLFYRNQEQTIIYGRIPGMIVESCSCI